MLFPEVINADVGTGSRESEATKIMVPLCTLQLWDASVPGSFLGRARHRASRLEEIRVCQDDLGLAGPEQPPHCFGMCFCVIFSLASWFDLSVPKCSAIYSGPWLWEFSDRCCWLTLSKISESRSRARIRPSLITTNDLHLPATIILC